MTPDIPLPPRVRTFAARHLAALAPLPCRVEAMTAREYAIYQALIPAVAALQTLVGWGDAVQAVLAQGTPKEDTSSSATPIADQMRAMLRLVGRIFLAGTQRDLDKLQLWLAAYAEAIDVRTPPQEDTP